METGRNCSILVSSLLALVLVIGTAADYIQAQSDGSANPLLSATDELLGLLNMAQPASLFPEQTQHREQALTDHTNDAIFSSTTQEIIERSGFEQQTHYVTSEDGYITELINVINPLANRSQLKQPPLMIFHGGLIDTSIYVIASAIQHHPEKYPRTSADGPITSSNRSLGFMLANYGYDVWLVATRGSNRQNLGHTTLKARLLEDILAEPLSAEAPREILDTIKYYDFSEDELVEKEFPAQIDRVLNLTGSSKVSTITYSLSTHVMFKLLASNEEVSKRIYTNCALQPLLDRIGTSTTVNAFFDLTLAVPNSVGTLALQLITTQTTRNLLRSVDRYTITYSFYNTLLGFSPKYQTFLEDPIVGHVLLPVSFVELKHYAQQTLVSRLQKFDHGLVKNLELYGQATPPVYNISDIQIKRWMLTSGDTDNLGTQSSADKYSDLIPNKPYKHLRHVNGWHHLDTAAAFEVDTEINLPILEFFDHFSSQNATIIALAD